RFIDTAGIRETQDVVESIGIKKTFEKITQAQLVIYLFDASHFAENSDTIVVEIEKIKNKFPQKPLLILANKIDLANQSNIANKLHYDKLLFISAKQNKGVDHLKEKLLEFVNTGALRNNETIVTNSRH